MILNLIKAFLIGILISAPLGPPAILVIQKTISGGRRVGLISSFGVTTSDTISAVISIFALGLAQNFIDSNENLIILLGGVILLLLGVWMAFKNPFKNIGKEKLNKSWSVKDYFHAFAITFFNPAGLGLMLTFFAFFKMGGIPHNMDIIPIIMAVSLGSLSYWLCFTWLFSHIRNKANITTLFWINRIAGFIIILISIAVLSGGFYKIVF